MQPRGQRFAPVGVLALLLMASWVAVAAGPVAAVEGRDTSLRADRSSQTVEAGESAEYTITVTYSGEGGTVTVSCANDPAQGSSCNLQGPTGSGSQISLVFTEDDSQEVTLTVATTTFIEDGEDIVTTVTASDGVPPETSDIEVTTRVTGGTGGNLWGVSLSTPILDKTWAPGQTEVEWVITVKNTGQQAATITVDISDDRCGVLELEFDPNTQQTFPNVAADDEETFDLTIDVPAGTEAGRFCLHLEAAVQGDVSGNATDELDIQLTVPEVKSCEIDLSATTLTLDPDERERITATFSNDGNTDWTLRTAVTPAGRSSWVAWPDGTSGLLPYDDNGEGELEKRLDITPDDSVEAGEEVRITIEGRDGSTVACSEEIRIIVGQSHAASASLSPGSLSSVQPGTTATAQLRVANQGNGGETLKISASGAPEGWSVRLSPTQVTLIGRHSNPADQRATNVEVNVSVPNGAFATETVRIQLTVASTTGRTYAMANLSISVAEVHDLDSSLQVESQYGRPNSVVKFPLIVNNPGNVQDTYALRVVSQGASPEWQVSFQNESGGQIFNVEVPPRDGRTVYVAVRIDGEEELDTNRITIRVSNMADGALQQEHEVTAVYSDRTFSVSLLLESPGDAGPSADAVTLPPGGRTVYDLVITNTGDQADEAIIWAEGLSSFVSVTISVDGVVLDDGAISLNQSETRQVRVEISVSDNAPDGSGGSLLIKAASQRNTAEPGIVTLTMNLRTLHDLELRVVDGDTTERITYPANARFKVEIVNLGNVEEVIQLSTSDGVRGWQILLDVEEIELAPGTSQVVVVVVQPPFSTTVKETFDFTFSAEPDGESRIGARHLDLSVEGEPAPGGPLPAPSAALALLVVLLAGLVAAGRGRVDE